MSFYGEVGRAIGTHGKAVQVAPVLSKNWLERFLRRDPASVLVRPGVHPGDCPCGFTSFGECDGNSCGYLQFLEDNPDAS